ncbi:MAG: cold shock domain-containing protein [Streptosporangiaceae bacterium]|jgi:CspA family cold shock protein
MLTGTVTLYDSDEGWGAIRPDGPLPGGDIWFHFAAIEMSGFRELSAGDRVEFDGYLPSGEPGYEYMVDGSVRKI